MDEDYIDSWVRTTAENRVSEDLLDKLIELFEASTE